MGKPKQIQKKDLVLAAKKQLLNVGQDSVTLKNVAETAGVTQGVVYYHFKAKQQLLLSLLDQYMDDVDHLNQTTHTVKDILSEEMYKAQTSSEEQHLLIQLAALSLHQKELKQKLGQAMRKRIQIYSGLLSGDVQKGRILAALVDGLALQSVFDASFPEKDMYTLAKQITDQLKLE